jgi:anaerobic magnesium-protoporphyrin IX monomethyl ester cyclase
VKEVCLVIPPSAFLLDERVFLSLGILKIAAVLEAAGIAVEVLDLSGVENYLDAVRDHVASSGARVFGITATTPQMPAASRIRAALREARPEARLILGGPHATLVHAAARMERQEGRHGRGQRAWDGLRAGYDVLVAGDGEAAIFEALGPAPPPVIDADDPKSALFLDSERLSRLPFPARHLVDVDSYHYTIDGERALSLIAQLGCPFGCGFCGGRLSPFLRRVRMRSAENVVAEVAEMHQRYGVRGFMLYDDELNVNPGLLDLMQRLARLQERLGETFRLRGFIKAQLFTAEQAEAMRAAGFRWILVGFESGSERILDNIEKKAARADNTRCLRLAHAAGLKVKALMSVGHPGESAETLAETRAWLVENKPDDFDLSLITTYPGTPYFDAARETTPGVWTYAARNGDRLHSLEVDHASVAEYYKGMPGSYASFVWTDTLSRGDLVRWRDRLEAEVRAELGLAYPGGAAAQRYEHSMGQRELPANLLRRTATAGAAERAAGAGEAR